MVPEDGLRSLLARWRLILGVTLILWLPSVLLILTTPDTKVVRARILPDLSMEHVNLARGRAFMTCPLTWTTLAAKLHLTGPGEKLAAKNVSHSGIVELSASAHSTTRATELLNSAIVAITKRIESLVVEKLNDNLANSRKTLVIRKAEYRICAGQLKKLEANYDNPPSPSALRQHNLLEIHLQCIEADILLAHKSVTYLEMKLPRRRPKFTIVSPPTPVVLSGGSTSLRLLAIALIGIFIGLVLAMLDILRKQSPDGIPKRCEEG